MNQMARNDDEIDYGGQDGNTPMTEAEMIEILTNIARYGAATPRISAIKELRTIMGSRPSLEDEFAKLDDEAKAD
jgi:hypothetical protein